MTFTITVKPYLDTFNKTYRNILTVNIVPQGPLARFIRQVRLPSLSPFQHNSGNNNSNNNNNRGCCSAIMDFLGSHGYNNDLMSPDHYPDLLSFLASNGYQIETQLTALMNQSEVKLDNSRILCAATYYGNNQPGIMYMK